MGRSPGVPAKSSDMAQMPETSEVKETVGPDSGSPAEEPILPHKKAVITHSGRESRPLKRFQHEQFCRNATLILSVANTANQNIVQNIFQSWLTA